MYQNFANSPLGFVPYTLGKMSFFRTIKAIFTGKTGC
jgi:hypothetical protein